MFDPRQSVSSSREPTTNRAVGFSPSLEVVRDDMAAPAADHPALEPQCTKSGEEGPGLVLLGAGREQGWEEHTWSPGGGETYLNSAAGTPC